MPIRIKLFEHNQIAYEKVEAMLQEETRAAVVHPTGTGKSYIAFALAAAHSDKRFVWLAPSEYIYNLQSKKLKKSDHVTLQNIEFHTYVWLMRNEDRISELNPDYIVLDEFHRAGATEWGKSVHRLIDSYPQAKILGLSATNIRYLDNQRDMADELFLGNIASEMGLCEAIARGILPEPKYVISVYNYKDKLWEYDKQIKELQNKSQKQVAEKLLERLRRTLEKADGIDRIFEKHLRSRNSKIIIFCANADHMMEMITLVSDWFRLVDQNPRVYHVYSYNPDSESDFREFVEDDSDHLKLLYCIDMLNEGIHVDDVDAVVLCRPTVSPIVYKQQIGRAIASGSTKKPVIFDMVNNFDNLYQIDALKEEFDELKLLYARAENDFDNRPEGFEIIDELKDCRNLLEQIQKNLDSTWDIYYQELKKYKEQNGDVKVPMRHITEDGLLLGRWLSRQKSMYQESKLSKEKTQMLELLGMDFDSISDQRFDRWFKLLVEYKNEHGNLEVPVRYTTSDGYNLGNFCYNIRGRYKKGLVSQRRIDTLNSIGFIWETFTMFWEEGYAHAKAYYEQHGNINLPKRYICEDGYKLGLWLYTQRSVRKGRVTGNLNEEKIQRLDKLGMVWELEKRDRFEHNVESLKKYIQEHGDSLIPYAYIDDDGVQLGHWAARMNRIHFSGKIPKDREKILLEAGFEFDSISRQWKTHYVEAKEFYKKNGHLLVPVSYTKEKGGTLSAWVNAQRIQYRRPDHGRLSEEQAKLLEELNIDDGDKIEQSFKRGVNHLKEYINENHDNIVPADYVSADGYCLGKWLSRQRTNYKMGRLREDQIKLLEESGMQWESLTSLRARKHWNEMFGEAKKYAEEHGSLVDMPFAYETEDGKKLGCWVQELRKIRRGTQTHSIELTPERIAELDALGINWGRSVF